ncbi:hypothetical protein G6553_07045 [Nocardioides sp. IC4_145]|uniref:hypothetical protein n=1 Tax=Nocardioides sp. IC4_145 TaxID=2714037 RepID=UPI00140C62E5|nr:hypothetical protein [Nocardioides sp. IC4_145]NHC22927.1 hypothetical protein [Nocardioides sp. IC4_145]
MLIAAAGLALLIALVVFAVTTDDTSTSDVTGRAAGKHGQHAVGDDGPLLIGHIHGIAPTGDGGALIGAHYGVFAVDTDGNVVEHGERRSDTMGLTDVNNRDETGSGAESDVESGTYLASGHPNADETDKPIYAGLLTSTDGGATWEETALTGEVDFHALDHEQGRTWGIDSVTGRILTATSHREWDTVDAGDLGPLLDVAADPTRPSRAVVTNARGEAYAIRRNAPSGRVFTRLPSAPSLAWLDWPAGDVLAGLSPSGTAYVSTDAGRNWIEVGTVPGVPSALAVTADGNRSAEDGGGAAGQHWWVATDAGLYAAKDGASFGNVFAFRE